MTTVSFDGVNKIATISLSGSIAAKSIYSRWLDWACDPVNAGYARAFDDGNALITVDQYSNLTSAVQFTVLNGWVLQTTGTCTITGGIFVTASGASPFSPTAGQAIISYQSTAISQAPTALLQAIQSQLSAIEGTGFVKDTHSLTNIKQAVNVSIALSA